MSFTDISTGYFYVMILEYEEEKLLREILKRGIAEVIVNNKMDRLFINTLRQTYHILVTIQEQLYEEEDYQCLYQNISDARMVTTIKHLLYYLIDTKKGSLSHLQPVEIVSTKQYLLFDIYTKKNLELVETMRMREKTYSLLWLLDKNKTAMGSRLLKFNIENPMTDKEEIEARYDMIDKLRTEFILKEELKEQLDAVYDLERLAGRISYGNLNARDLLQLKQSLKVLPQIKEILEQLAFPKKIDTLEELYELLEKSIYEEPPLGLKEGSLIKSGYNQELDDLKTLRSGSKEFILQLENEEKQ